MTDAASRPSPLQRVRRRASGEEGVVHTVLSHGHVAVTFPSGYLTVHPDELDVIEDTPVPRLDGATLGRAQPYALRLQALYLRHAYKYDPLSGLSNARIEPALHQIYVADRVTRKVQPRMILADEVGLGKTIEAGLILKEFRARGLLQRVLVICPASLQLQWQHELASKFNEPFEIIDGMSARLHGRGGANPYEAVPNAITSLSFVTRKPRAEQVTEATWDLVIFDEAHRVRRTQQGRKTSTTRAYELADELKDATYGLLLLTATPMQISQFELYSLIELVEPGLYPTAEAFAQGGPGLKTLNEAMRQLQAWATLTEGERRAFLDRHQDLLEALDLAPGEALTALDDSQRREKTLDRIAQEHPLAQVMVRNRKVHVGIKSERRARLVPVTLTGDELNLYWDITEYLRDGYNRALAQEQRAVGFLMVIYQKMLASSSRAIRESLRRRVRKLKAALEHFEERKAANLSAQRLEELRELEDPSDAVQELATIILAPDALKDEIALLEDLVRRLGQVADAKAHRLLDEVEDLLGDDPDEKVIIFTQYIETQTFLVEMLKGNGYRVEAFNGRQSADEKEEAVRRFRASAQVFVSTESGGEGRNLQFCHNLINYDLPWNPMKVEQRIGRLDRIGQQHPVHIRNFYCAETIEERIVTVLDARINLFEEAVGSLDPILGSVEAELERLVMAGDTDEGFLEYSADLERRVREARELERTMGDLALDRASFRSDRAAELLGQTQLATWQELRRYVDDTLRYHGGVLTANDDGSDTISLAPTLVAKLRRDRVKKGVFDPRHSLELENLDFFAFGHDLVDGLVGLPLDGQEVRTAARLEPDGPASPHVEAWYAIEAEGLHPEGHIRRHVVGSDLHVASEDVTAFPTLSTTDAAVDVPEWAAEAVEASQTLAQQEFEEARSRILAKFEEARAERFQRAQRIHSYRRKRLQDRLSSDEALIAEKEASTSERDRRILPALRGRAGKNRERLAVLEDEHLAELEKIRMDEPETGLRTLAVGLVVAP